MTQHFGDNLSYYRKKAGLTQEDLAEKMGVTRQTVFRWESGSILPDTEKLIALCDLFSCDMDTLVRGNIGAETAAKETQQVPTVSLETYDRHMNRHTARISGGVALILAGVSAMLFLSAAGVPEIAGVVTLLACVALAVGLFVYAGITHGDFCRECHKAPAYPAERTRTYRRLMPLLISGATVLILAGVIAVVIMTGKDSAPAGWQVDRWEYLAVAILLSTVTLATGVYVSAGMLDAKYRGAFNDDAKEESESSVRVADLPLGARILDALTNSIMLIATAIFLLLGFAFGMWHPGWIVFPVGGVLCGVFAAVRTAMYGDKNS